MPGPASLCGRFRDVLRLTFSEGLGRRQVSASLGFSFTAVADHVARAISAGFSWPLLDGLDDQALEISEPLGVVYLHAPVLVQPAVPPVAICPPSWQPRPATGAGSRGTGNQDPPGTSPSRAVGVSTPS